MQHILAFIATILFIFLLRKPAERYGFVDRPGGRKKHTQATPVVGGVAMFLAFSVLMFSSELWHSDFMFALWGGAAIVVALGMADDRWDLKALPKFFGQICAVVFVACYSDTHIIALSNLLGTGPLLLGNWGLPFTVFCVVGIMNAINMTDGADGLAGGVCLIALLWMIFAVMLAGVVDVNMAALLLIMVGAVTGYLAFNYRTPWNMVARIFMGDAGSLMLGFILAWLAVYMAGGPINRIFPPIVAVWILGLPIIDTLAVMTRRILRGRDPFAADREHLHHILLGAGLSVRHTVVLMLSVSFVFGGIGILGWGMMLPSYVMFYAFVIVLLAHIAMLSYAWKVQRFLRIHVVERIGEQKSPSALASPGINR